MNASVSPAMSAPTRRHHGSGFINRFTIVGLIGICLIALGALVACPTEEDESESSDASLSALTLSDGTLSPTFASDTLEYTATVASSVESVTVTATPTDTGASTDITPTDADTATDGHQVGLQEGGNPPIRIVVTAEDGSTTSTYMITVTRTPTSGVPTTININGRTQQVQDAIVATSQVTATDRTAIPTEQLAAITSLTVSGLSSLMADDFANLSGLTELDISGNSGLTTLPSGIFDALLDTLTTLTVDDARKGEMAFATASGDIAQGAMGELSVTLTTALPTAVQIPYTVAFANSADAAGFSNLADGVVTFAAGSTNAQSISVTATATAEVGDTATLTLGTPVLTADTRDPNPLDPASLVSVGSGNMHTLTVVLAPSATLSVTDDSVTEEAADGTPGRAAVFTLALVNLPTSGADDVSIFYTVAGFAGDIGNGSAYVIQFGAIASTTGAAVDIMTNATGVGRVAINRADGGSAADMDIDGNGSATVEFLLMLQKDDGNVDDETITLTINCVARSRTGQGEAGCTSAGAFNILVAQESVVDNPASVIGDDDIPFERLPEQDFNTLNAARNIIPWGIWSNGTTMWVVDFLANKLFAYNLTTKARDSSKEVNTPNAVGNGAPSGLWSDGTTIWVADISADKIFAYTLTTKARDSSEEFNTLNAAGNNIARGLWSDDTTMWVSDNADHKLFAYNLTSKARDSSKEFNTLNGAGNNNSRGLWSDDTTMWVADDGDDKLYAYNLSSKARDSSKEFNNLAAGNNYPTGLWSDGTTMWVSDSVAAKIFAYRMPPTE